MTNCGENTVFSGKHKPTARQCESHDKNVQKIEHQRDMFSYSDRGQLNRENKIK